MSRGKVDIEISADLYDEVKRAVEKLGLYSSVEDFAVEAIRWNLRRLKDEAKGLYSVKVNENLMQFLAEAVRKTGKKMEDLTDEDIKRFLMREFLNLSPEEFRLLEAVVHYGKEYGSIEDYVRETVLSALANDLIEAGNEIERKS